MPRPVALSVESLDVRDLPAVFGNVWPNAGALTLSFAPDDTVIAGYSQAELGVGQASKLFTELAATGTVAQWQTEALRAFQVWAANANINIGLVPDAGSPFGAASTAPGAGSSGAIRLGAYAASADVIAINQPFNPIGEAWSGDVLFNTTRDFAFGTQSGKYDLFTVAMHEAGNVFGLADRDSDMSAALNGNYTSARTGLNAADISAIQGMYGTRTPDAWESNETLATAKRLTPYTAPTDSTKKMVSAVGADLTTATDLDHFVFQTQADTTSATVRLETVGKSLLAGKVSVYTTGNVLLGTATSAGPQAMQDLVLTVTGLAANTDYVVKVEKAAGTAFAVGRYDLKVGYNFNPVSPPASPPTVSYLTDAGTDETIATARTVTATAGSANRQYEQSARIETAADVDIYRVTAPATTGAPITVVLTPSAADPASTAVTVFNSSGAVVPAQILAHTKAGQRVLQVANPVASQVYYLKVVSAPLNGVGATGNYTLTADFTQPTVSLSTVTSATLGGATTTAYSKLTVPEAKMFQFTLQATSTDTSVASGVRMIIYDASNRIVATLTSDAGGTRSGAVLLNAGTYTVKFEAATRTGAALSNLAYTLKTVVLSDPIDVYDPTAEAMGDYQTGTYTGPSLDDPWLDPWSGPVG